MSKEIKVSMVVPIYNVEKYLARCIESLVNQTLEEIEIILVNDGSKDNSQAIIDEYAKKYPEKIIPLIKENGGLSDARNYGIPYAKGEYIGFLDSDDYCDRTFLEKMYHQAKTTDSQIVVCGYYGVDEIENKFRWLQKGNMSIYNTHLSENPTLIHFNAPYAWNKIYHRSLFDNFDIRYPKGLIWEDIPTTYPLLACANRISKVDQPLIYYVLKREGSITGTYNRKMLQLFDSLSLLIERYKKLGVFEEYYDELLFINMRHIIFRFKEFNKYKDAKMKWEFVNKGFKHLDTYFPGWKKNPYYNTYYDVNKPFKQWRMKSKLYWSYFILVPNFIHAINSKFARIPRLFRKVRRLFSKYSRTRYAYTKAMLNKPIDENAVLFESFHGKTLSDSPFYMMKDVLERYPDKKIYFTTNNYEEHQELVNTYHLNVELVQLNTPKYGRILATAKYLVNNVSFPPYFIRRPEQKYLNTWHGTPLKTLGKNMVEGIEDMSNMQRNFLHSTELLFPNDYTMAHMMEDYNLFGLFNGKAIVSGYPRNTIFMDTEKAKQVRKQFNLEDKEVFAYMPTWRGAQSNVANNDSYKQDVEKILQTLDEQLTDNQILFVNLHSLIKDKIEIEGYKHIQVFPNIDNYEFLNCVDVLISDYSSVFFDFSITKKPIVLFMYDYEEYMGNRGTYFDIRTLPFEKIYTLDHLVEYLKKSPEEKQSKDYGHDYFNQFAPYDSLDATQKLNDYFFKDIQTDMHYYDYKDNKETMHTLYFPKKIVDRETLKEFEEVLTLENPVVVFMKSQFNYLLREELLNKYNNKINYIVVKYSIPITLLERIKGRFARTFKFIHIDDINMRAFSNILPNVKFNKIVYRENPSKFTKRIIKSYKNKQVK